MPACHTTTMATTPTAMQSLRDLVAGREQTVEPLEDFQAFEGELHETLMAVGRELIAEEMARFDIDVPSVCIDLVPHTWASRDFHPYMTRFGTVRVQRTLYRAHRDERAVAALDLRIGIVEGWWTPAAAMLAMWAVAHLTAKEAKQLFQRVGGMTPSQSSLDTLPRELNAQWEDQRTQFEECLRHQDTVPPNAVAVGMSLDGVMLPMKGINRAALKQQAKDEGKAGTGAIGCKEASCGTFTFYGADGERIGVTRYLGRMPESKKATLKASLEDGVVAILDQRPDLTWVGLADGAKDNWTFIRRVLPPGSPLALDFYHGSQQLKKGLDSAYGKRSERSGSEHRRLRRILRDADDGVQQVICELIRLHREHPRRSKLLRVLRFFLRFRQQMKYAVMQASNLPIGSGIVEAANKTLVTVRMKRAGARWRHPGGQGVLTFRALAKSERYDDAWELLRPLYKQDVALPNNVLPFKPKSRPGPVRSPSV